MKKIQDKRLYIQKEYIFKKLIQNEKEQKIHHDVQKHMEAIKLFFNKKSFKELEEYVETYIRDYSENNLINTGNIIADYFIEKTINTLKEQNDFEYKIIGEFPQDLIISDNDLCTIIGNALNNAGRAISDLEKGGKLFIEIRNLNNHLYLVIKNNKSNNFDKYGGKTFGIGMRIMKAVVKKYKGKIWFTNKKDVFMLRIII